MSRFTDQWGRESLSRVWDARASLRAPTIGNPLTGTRGIGRTTAEIRDQIVAKIGGYPGESAFSARQSEAFPEKGATFVRQQRVPPETSNNFPFGVRHMLIPPKTGTPFLRLEVWAPPPVFLHGA